MQRNDLFPGSIETFPEARVTFPETRVTFLEASETFLEALLPEPRISLRRFLAAGASATCPPASN